MAIRSSAGAGKLALAAARGAVMLCGLAVVVWASNSFGLARNAVDVDIFARQIIAGNRFADASLTTIVSRFDVAPAHAVELPSLIRSAAIVRLRHLESAIVTGGPDANTQRGTSLEKALQASLVLTPADPFLWFTKFWLENNTRGYRPDNLKYLDYSYELGPREQWIAERRSRAAITAFSELKLETQERVIAEYAGLVESNLLTETASILVGPGWAIRDRLLAGLSGVDISRKLAMVRFLGREGFRVQFPGVPEMDERPWR